MTTFAVAAVARWLVPDLPWTAAVALGAIVAPPDAVAATAILRRLRPPHRLIVILEGESLLNDATALLIYRVAVTAVVAGGLSPASALPTFGLVVVGSIVLGAILGWSLIRLLAAFKEPPSAIILQFITTFGVWILAEKLHLSGIITIVVYAMVIARTAPARTSASLRVPSYAVWETTVFVLQTMAFVLIGLQLRPILANLGPQQIGEYIVIALAVLATVIIVRLSWVMTYQVIAKLTRRAMDGAKDEKRPAASTRADGLIIAWCGMRGIVTLAAAYALPGDFPHRDLILLCAFTVVVGTLLMQGLTLPLLLRRLSPRDDRPVEREFRMARKLALKAAIAAIGDAPSDVAVAVRREYDDMLAQTRDSEQFDTAQNRLRRDALAAARDKALELRRNGTIGRRCIPSARGRARLAGTGRGTEDGRMSANVDVVVVGAGAAGIAAARQLADAGLSLVVIEAGDRIGGRAWTIHHEGLPIDLGCGWLHSADRNPWAALAPALGFTVDRTLPPWGRQFRNLGFPAADQEAARSAFARFEQRLRHAPTGTDRAADLLEDWRLLEFISRGREQLRQRNGAGDPLDPGLPCLRGRGHGDELARRPGLWCAHRRGGVRAADVRRSARDCDRHRRIPARRRHGFRDDQGSSGNHHSADRRACSRSDQAAACA